jgi:uncharacterized protein (UPF0248 family)
MQPLSDLLHRIAWDAGFAKGAFAIGYIDRVAGGELVVPFTSMALDPGGASFSLRGADGVVAHIPLHRVRTVYRDGVAIWQRPPRPPAD